MRLLLFCFMLGPTTAFASGYTLVQQGAETMGMAHTGVALPDAPEAAWFNPALLTDNGGLRIALGATLAAAQIQSEALPNAPDAPWAAQTESSLSVPPHLYASYAKNNWAIGGTFNVAHGSRIKWPDDWPYRFDIVESKPQFFRATAFGAIQLGPVSATIGPQFDMGSLYIHRATQHIMEEGSAQLGLRGWGWGLHGGLAFKLHDEWTVGLRVQSHTRLSLSGEADFDVPQPFATDYPDQGVRSQWALPAHIQLGARWHRDAYSLALEVGVDLWSIQKQAVFELEATEALTIDYNWRNSASVRLGGHWSPNPWLTLRAGGYVDGLPAPSPVSTLSPASPDATRLGVTTGVGLDWADKIGIHLAYEGMSLLPRASESTDAPPATYNGQAHFVGLSTTVQIR